MATSSANDTDGLHECSANNNEAAGDDEVTRVDADAVVDCDDDEGSNTAAAEPSDDGAAAASTCATVHSHDQDGTCSAAAAATSPSAESAASAASSARFLAAKKKIPFEDPDNKGHFYCKPCAVYKPSSEFYPSHVGPDPRHQRRQCRGCSYRINFEIKERKRQAKAAAAKAAAAAAASATPVAATVTTTTGANGQTQITMDVATLSQVLAMGLAMKSSPPPSAASASSAAANKEVDGSNGVDDADAQSYDQLPPPPLPRATQMAEEASASGGGGGGSGGEKRSSDAPTAMPKRLKVGPTTVEHGANQRMPTTTTSTLSSAAHQRMISPSASPTVALSSNKVVVAPKAVTSVAKANGLIKPKNPPQQQRQQPQAQPRVAVATKPTTGSAAAARVGPTGPKMVNKTANGAPARATAAAAAPAHREQEYSRTTLDMSLADDEPMTDDSMTMTSSSRHHEQGQEEALSDMSYSLESELRSTMEKVEAHLLSGGALLLVRADFAEEIIVVPEVSHDYRGVLKKWRRLADGDK